MRRSLLLVICVFMLLIAACSGQTGEQSEQTKVALANTAATADSLATQQAKPSSTTAATATATMQPTIAPSATPVPTNTSSPTFTPSPIPKPVQKDPLVLALAEGVEIPLVRVPAGEFLMGSGPEDKKADKDEQPQHTVYLDEYLIGKTEVTVAQYRFFMQTSGFTFPGVKKLPEGQDNYPVTGLLYEEAVAFVQWLSEWTGLKVTLPTEAQWEKAARGTDGRIYPWGNSPTDCAYANINNCNQNFEPVGSHPLGASPYGALDMIGNAEEICNDFYASDYYASSPASNPTGPEQGIPRTLRGGCWFKSWDLAKTYSRMPYTQDYIYYDGCCQPGFRVAVAVE